MQEIEEKREEDGGRQVIIEVTREICICLGGVGQTYCTSGDFDNLQRPPRLPPCLHPLRDRNSSLVGTGEAAAVVAAEVAAAAAVYLSAAVPTGRLPEICLLLSTRRYRLEGVAFADPL